jgi:hypothetical protein
MRVVTTREKIQSHLSDRGTACLFFGYPSNHTNDVYKLLNPITKHFINLRDVIWLNTTKGESIRSKGNIENVDDDILYSEIEIGSLMNLVEQKIKPDNEAKSVKINSCERF